MIMRQLRVDVRFRQQLVGFHVQKPLSYLRLPTQGVPLYSGLMALASSGFLPFSVFKGPAAASGTSAAFSGQRHPAPIERHRHLAREQIQQSRGRVSIKHQNNMRKDVSPEERRGPDVVRWILQVRTA